MQPGNAAGLHHPFQKVTAFHAKHLHVIQPADGRPGTNPPYAAQKPFYSQKTALRIMGRHLKQESSVPTPQINLKRTIRAKNIRRRQHLEKSSGIKAGFIMGINVRIRCVTKRTLSNEKTLSPQAWREEARKNGKNKPERPGTVSSGNKGDYKFYGQNGNSARRGGEPPPPSHPAAQCRGGKRSFCGNYAHPWACRESPHSAAGAEEP